MIKTTIIMTELIDWWLRTQIVVIEKRLLTGE